MDQTQCLFVEPWIGNCKEVRVGGELCCEKHAAEKCSVCGDQATTRCQASIGLMCGVPLCHRCGHDEMCLHHATAGPLAIIRVLAGGQAYVPSIFGTAEDKKLAEDKFGKIVERLKASADANRKFDEAIRQWAANCRESEAGQRRAELRNNESRLFRKRPVVIEARQIDTLDYDELCDIVKWCGGRAVDADTGDGKHVIAIDTDEGTMYANNRDWVIKGVKGEFYPCKPDVFEALYDAAAEE